MSAFIVSKKHIDALITAGLSGNECCRMSWDGTTGYQRYATIAGQTPRCELDYTVADAVGRMLWQENYRSVYYRYPEDTPAGDDLRADSIEADTYRFAPKVISPVAALKQVNCFEYQSCEHPEWETSEAAAFCAALKDHLIRLLPGYEDAEWGI